MAVRTNILYETGGDLRIMSAAQELEIKWLAAWFYQQNPVETLSYVASGGDLTPTMTDRRYQAGTALTGADGYVASYASEAATPDITAIDTTFDRISRTRISSTGIPDEPEENATLNAFPCYWDNANKVIKAMTKQDFFDTFIGPTITDGLVGTGSVNKLAAGTYTILTTGSSVSGNPGTTIVSTNPVFVDTRADASAYTGAGIPEAQDQPTTVNSYYLHLIRQSTKPTYQTPLFVRSDGTGVQVYTTATFEAMIEDYIRSATYGLSGYSITYEFDTSVSNQKGTSLNDTYLSGTSAQGYTQYLVNNDDYRTQEFPNGTVAILNSYKLGITTAASVTLTSNVSSVNEGGTVTFTLTTANLDPGTHAYTITGIDSGDLSSGSLTGNFTTTGTYSSASGTVSVTLANDTATEGTETMTMTVAGKSIDVTVNDTSTQVYELVSLEGTTGSPEQSTSTPLTDGSTTVGFRFSSTGDVEDYDVDRVPQYVATGHVDWVNVSPTKTYYIRGTVYSQSSSHTQSGASLNTWLALSSNRSFRITDGRASASYSDESIVYKIEISESATGSDQSTLNQYSTTSGSEYWWRQQSTSPTTTRISVMWNGDMIFDQDGYTSIPSSVTGLNGYTYSRNSLQTGEYYRVDQTIPGILDTGYYQCNWEGGA